jgi:hypothetical protein
MNPKRVKNRGGAPRDLFRVLLEPLMVSITIQEVLGTLRGSLGSLYVNLSPSTLVNPMDIHQARAIQWCDA